MTISPELNPKFHDIAQAAYWASPHVQEFVEQMRATLECEFRLSRFEAEIALRKAAAQAGLPVREGLR